MNINQIRYVLKIAQCHSFSRASEELFITQPTLSQQINKLEHELKLTLFERTTRSIKLTDAGNDFIKYAQKIVDEWAALEHTMTKHLNLERGRIVLGVLPTLSKLNLTTHITAFMDIYPEVTIELTEVWSEELISKLLSHEIDIAILNPVFPADCNFLSMTDCYPIVEDSLMLVVNASHPLSNSPYVLLDDLKQLKMIMLSGHSSVRKTISKAFEKSNINPLIVCECSGTDTMIGLVADGMGVSFLTSKVAEKYAHNNVKAIPILPPIKSQTALVLSKYTQHDKITLAFKNYILDKFNVKEKQEANNINV